MTTGFAFREGHHFKKSGEILVVVDSRSTPEKGPRAKRAEAKTPVRLST